MLELYKNIVDNIQFVQVNYKNDMTGEQKKELVLNRLRLFIRNMDVCDIDKDYYNKFVVEGAGELIDSIIIIVRNKELVKLFKKHCDCIPF